MIKHFCDRCGVEITRFHLGSLTIDHKPWAHWDHTAKDYDLCPECLVKAETFIQGEGVKNESVLESDDDSDPC